MHKITGGNYSVHSYPYPNQRESRCDGSFETFDKAQKEYNRLHQLETKGHRPRKVAKRIWFFYDKGDELICPVCGGKKRSTTRNWINDNGMAWCKSNAA